ncbi:helix-turn-helix domain-containing protein [Escherichia coli]|nr:helix-turn-helix domain-containing protein [Escherichia coli]
MSETMAERIKKLRIEHNMTQEELGEKVGIKRAAINKYEKGNVENMKRSMIEKMSSIFGVSPVYLMALDDYSSSSIEKIYNQLSPPRQEKVYVFAKNQLDEQEKENSRNKNITSLEQYKQRKQQKKSMSVFYWCGAVSAGTGEFLADEYREEITLPTEIIPDDADFCLTVNGASMEPIFHDDDYVFVKRQLEVFSGAIGVVILNGQAFLKRIWFENDIARLQSFNSDYDDIIVTENDDFRIIGKVVM